MNVNLFGLSTQGIPILEYHLYNPNAYRILVLGGVHGDEIEGVILAQRIIADLLNSPADFQHLNIKIIPEMNIEGVLNKTRGNSQGVDLNRNLPTQDWSAEVKTPRYHPGPFPLSEVENKNLVKCIEEFQPQFIISLHSWQPMININGDCLKQAQILNQMTGYRIDTDMGYPTPGCLGTYTGIERQIPTITLEIERGLSADKIIQIHQPAMKEFFNSFKN